MCCGSLLSTVMSSATCECIDQQQRLTRRNLFTAVQTNSKSTVCVQVWVLWQTLFSPDKLSCMVIQNTKQSGLAENNNNNNNIVGNLYSNTTRCEYVILFILIHRCILMAKCTPSSLCSPHGAIVLQLMQYRGLRSSAAPEYSCIPPRCLLFLL